MRTGGNSHLRRAPETIVISERRRFRERLHHYTALQEMIPISENDAGVSFAIKVHPRAKKAGITGELGDALKVSLTAPPVEGRANDACIELFAKALKVPRSSITIASGGGGRNKVIRVSGVTAQYVRERLHV